MLNTQILINIHRKEARLTSSRRARAVCYACSASLCKLLNIQIITNIHRKKPGLTGSRRAVQCGMPVLLHSTTVTVEYSNNDKYSVFTDRNLI